MTSTHDVRLPLFSDMTKPDHKRYRTLIADPPWRYNVKPPEGGTPYGTMTAQEIMNLPAGLWATDDAHLYLWTTNSFLIEAHQIVKAWGFEYKTLLTWVKRHAPANEEIGPQAADDKWIGMGFHFRGVTEHVLFATRGSLPVKRKDEPKLFYAPHRAHSEKPAAFYDLVARMSHGPYLDVFARTQRWVGSGETAFEVMATWGDQAFTPAGLPTPEELKEANR